MKSLFKYISSIFFTICLVLFFVVLMLFARELKDVPDITQANLQDPLSSEIYDKNLNLIATVGAEKREYVSINDIPKNITDAVLTTEDSRFQSHIGIDPIRLIKAVLVNIRSNSAQQGASTITQQVVKNSLLTSDKSLQRKIQEAYLSLKLENRYSKDDILEMYMNKIYYSDGQYGVKTAAKYFYNKELDQLTLSQVALLTGIPQQPILYNPYDYPKQAKERRDTVLYALLNNDKITEAEYNDAINTPITDGIVKKTKEERANQHTYNPKFAAYIDQITKELKENQNFENIKDPLSMGLKIYTNLNPELQIYVQDMLDNQSSPMKPHASQAAISVLDTKTGLIEAIGGGKNYKAGGYNFAVDARVQPGSSIKPLIDYAPGIEYYGWDSQTTFSDTPYQIAGTNFFIQNWDRLYHGTVSMSRALSWSYNTPAVRAFETVGYERAKHFAEKLDIPVTKDEPTTAIGGNVDGVSTLQMAGAFASFGNKGYFNKPSTIVKVFNATGKELPNIKAEPIKAMSEETAYLMTNVLKGVLTSNGLAPNGKVANFDMAGKSGSSTFDDTAYYNYGIDVVNSTKDSWMIGYTTDYTVAVWQGADVLDSAAKALSYDQAKTTQVIMANVMKKASDNKVPAAFEKPAGIESKNGVEYAKERNKETDYMYAGSDRDAVYQAALAQKQRENRSALTSVFNSLTNSTTNRTNQNQTTSRNATNNTTNTNRLTNQNTRR
ncbi:transglycosylase domain-containing protein [uncultured Gemella sp.]|uniref:transglycosylase domain-containing protein n=1 Tax=uncultured Gemella sp. TaxID=254352 RepID=UPI0028D76311|nr:transglycosylase domain-containing protein [uncultured Gemella sp.]